MEFTPITTQEQLDSIMGEWAKKYEGWVSPEDHQATVDALTTQKDENARLTAANKAYETASVKSRIADEIGLDRRLIDRLNGETEVDIRKDAKSLKSLFGESRHAPPFGEPEPVQRNSGGFSFKDTSHKPKPFGYVPEY